MPTPTTPMTPEQRLRHLEQVIRNKDDRIDALTRENAELRLRLEACEAQICIARNQP